MTEQADLSFQGKSDEGSAAPPTTPPASQVPEGNQEPGKESQATPPESQAPALSDAQKAQIESIAKSAADKSVSGYDKLQKKIISDAAGASEASRLAAAQQQAGDKAAENRVFTAEGTRLIEAAGLKFSSADKEEMKVIGDGAATGEGNEYLKAIEKAITMKKTRLANAPEQTPPEETPEEGAPAGNANRAAVGINAGSGKVNPLADENNATVLLGKAFNPD